MPQVDYTKLPRKRGSIKMDSSNIFAVAELTPDNKIDTLVLPQPEDTRQQLPLGKVMAKLCGYDAKGCLIIELANGMKCTLTKEQTSKIEKGLEETKNEGDSTAR